MKSKITSANRMRTKEQIEKEIAALKALKPILGATKMPRRIFTKEQVEERAIADYIRHVANAGYEPDWNGLPQTSKQFWISKTQRRMVRERWLRRNQTKQPMETTNG